jgi:hypothetical protein
LKITKIYSRRFFDDWPSGQIVYEWEDAFSKAYNIPIKNAKWIKHLWGFSSRFLFKLSLLRKLILTFDHFFFTGKKYLVFELAPSTGFHYTTREKSIPVIIDFWKTESLENFYSTYKACSQIFISSLEVYNYLKLNSCPLPINNLPLSLPDKYQIDPKTKFIKKYDVIIGGRINTVLFNFLKVYEKEFPNIEYIFQVLTDGKLYYYSNKNGNLGVFSSRKEYMELLRSCKIGFYSTPGMDEGETRTGGFNPVTPMFLEYLSAGCRIIARYPANEETVYYNLQHFCPSIDNYETFRKVMISYLQSEDSNYYASNKGYLNRHLTSARIALFNDLLK